MSAALSVHRADGHRLAVLGASIRWSYAELGARVAAAEHTVQALRLAPGARVAVVAEASASHLVGLCALLEQGLVPVLLHPRLPAGTRAQLAERAEAVDTVDLDRLVGGGAERPPSRPVRDPEDDYAIFFTSGSSGLPKGVRLSARAFEASARASARNLGWREDDRWDLALPLAHIGGFSVLTRTRLGSRALVLPGAPARFDPLRFVRRVEHHALTLLSLVPTMLRRVVQASLRAPPSVRAVLVGGAAAPSELMEAARALGWPVLATYGMTEACSQIACQAPGDPVGDDVGRALDGVRVRARGEALQIRGPTLCSGYLPPDPEAWTDDGWFVTGDRGRVGPKGRVQVLGRAGDLIVSGGENVAPARVEAALEAVPGVGRAVVFGLPDPEWGEVVAAVFERSPEGPTDRAGLRAALAGKLAPFERPKRAFVAEALPMLESGKLDRRAARARVVGPEAWPELD